MKEYRDHRCCPASVVTRAQVCGQQGVGGKEEHSHGKNASWKGGYCCGRVAEARPGLDEAGCEVSLSRCQGAVSGELTESCALVQPQPLAPLMIPV